MSFLQVKATEWGNPALTGVIKSLKRGELFWQFHLQYADEIDSAGDNLEVDSNSQANQLLNVCLQRDATTLNRKAASLEQTVALYVCAWRWSDRILNLTPAFPGLHVKTSISLPWVGEVPHLSGVPTPIWTGP